MSDIKAKIEQANQHVLDILVEGQPIWIGCKNAIDVIPGMKMHTILHAGPPIEWERMCQPMRNGILGAILYEGLANDLSHAEEMIHSGDINLAPCHDFHTVGGMTGITSATMPVAIVRNRKFGNVAYSVLHEGIRPKGFSWGNYDEETISNMQWIRDELAPVLDACLQISGGLNLTNVIARAIVMGDEGHNRCGAATSLIIQELAPSIVRVDESPKALERILEFLRVTDIFALHIIMAAGKSIADSAKNIAYSSVVTAMARNGVDFGIKVSALGEKWFIGPAQKVRTVYFSQEWNDNVATPDMGDSSIVEVIGLGGLIHAASPAQGYALECSYSDSLRKTYEAYDFCAGEHNTWLIPALDFRGLPLGIDIRKVTAGGITPILDTATAHINGGKIGFGEARAPMDAFEAALRAFGEELGTEYSGVSV